MYICIYLFITSIIIIMITLFMHDGPGRRLADYRASSAHICGPPESTAESQRGARAIPVGLGLWNLIIV